MLRNAAQGAAFLLGFDDTGWLTVYKEQIVCRILLELKFAHCYAACCAQVHLFVIMNLPAYRVEQFINFEARFFLWLLA
jgi:hypothetical protein